MLSRKMYDTRLFAALLCTLCLLAPATAQDSPAPAPQEEEEEVIRISTDLVQTDVMVFDKQGKFVEGLRPEQFELLVEGKPQSILFFERIKAGSANEDAQLAAARGGRREGEKAGVVLPLDRGRSVIFFVDDLHLSPGNSQRMRQTLVRFIDEEIGQNDEAQVTSASGQIGFLQQFTDNKAVMRAAVSRLNTRSSGLRDGQYPPMNEVQALAVERNDITVINFYVEQLRREMPQSFSREMAERMVRSRASQIIAHSNALAVSTLAALERVIRNSAPLPGRKVLFFISDGFILDAPDGSVRERVRRVADAAARASVVIYSLDAEGLRTNQPGADQAVAFDPSGQLTSTTLSEAGALQAPLYTLAADTGGRALVNTNALGKAVVGVLKETGQYYLLAWRPDGVEAGKGTKFQRVEVSVKDKPDLKVVVRRGFFSAGPPEEATARKKKEKAESDDKKAPRAERELAAAIQSLFPKRALPTSVSLGHVNDPTQGAVLTVSIEVDPTSVSAEPGSKNGGVVDLAGAVIDDRGKSVSSFREEITLAAAEAQPKPDDERPRVMYGHQLAVKPGIYQVRIATRDRQSGRTGSAIEWIEIPDLKNGQLTLSSLFLAERTAQPAQANAGAQEPAKGVLISVDRRFARSSWMRFGTVIYNAAGGAAAPPDVALQIQVFRDDQPVFTAPLSKVVTQGMPDLSRIPYAAELALSNFPAGRYVLQITAIDRAAKTSTSQRINFVIE